MWTSDDNEKLIESAQRSRTAQNKTDWDAVAREFPSRTRLQLKAQYTNNLKPASETYHKWTAAEEALLRVSVTYFGKNWRLVQQYFPGMNVKALQSKHYQLDSKLAEQLSLMSQIQRGSLDPSQLDQQKLQEVQQRVKLYSNRLAVRNGQ